MRGSKNIDNCIRSTATAKYIQQPGRRDASKEWAPPTAGMTATIVTSVTEEIETAEKMLATSRRKQN
jgi:hypothetical protein